MEEVAKKHYVKQYEEHHKDVKYRECGLFIYESKQYIGASPDLMLECSCCGKGVMEIKCPYSIVNEIPPQQNLPYLVNSDGNALLKHNHQYFAQIQGQMAVTGRHWCLFLVYTNKGQYVETIQFNKQYWNRLEQNLTWFYDNFLTQ